MDFGLEINIAEGNGDILMLLGGVERGWLRPKILEREEWDFSTCTFCELCSDDNGALGVSGFLAPFYPVPLSGVAGLGTRAKRATAAPGELSFCLPQCPRISQAV